MNWYDRPELYDALFAWDPATERDFVLGASERFGVGAPRRLLEPFCGTGRLLRALDGRAVGFDINPHMLRFAARTSAVFRADAAGFAVRPASFDAAYCLIDSFRYLLTERAARSHLACVARALRAGAVYALGFDLAGDISVEEWSMGPVHARVGMLGDPDPHTRIETFRARIDHGDEHIESFQPMRTYAAGQVRELVEDEGSFEIAAAFDRHYDLARPVVLEAAAGSIVLVLRRIRA